MTDIKCYIIDWETNDNETRTDYFCTLEFAFKTWKVIPGYVHTRPNPIEGARKFLEHLPLHNVKIRAYRN